jgi:hypothetical protein
MTQEQIQAELTERKGKIFAAKAAERERAKKKREAGQFADAANDLNPGACLCPMPTPRYLFTHGPALST